MASILPFGCKKGLHKIETGPGDSIRRSGAVTITAIQERMNG
jgi:hypothetical protein